MSPTDRFKRAWGFLQYGALSSVQWYDRFFMNIKRNFFQKVAFCAEPNAHQNVLFSKHAFWAQNVETNGRLVFVKLWLLFCHSVEIYLTSSKYLLWIHLLITFNQRGFGSKPLLVSLCVNLRSLTSIKIRGP